MDSPISVPCGRRKRRARRTTTPEAMGPRATSPSEGRKSRRTPEAMVSPVSKPSGGRKRKRRRRTTLNDLCPEVMADILSRFPPRTVLQLQLVSKSWRSLIQTHLLPCWLPNTMLGFFYHPHRVRHLLEHPGILPGRPMFHETGRAGGFNHGGGGGGFRAPILGFIPSRNHFRIADCCNGLLLFRRCSRRGKRRVGYFVCNPTTKRLQRLPLPQTADHNFQAFLAFDPNVSPHYKVLFAKNCSGAHPSSEFWIYSSETAKVRPIAVNQRTHLSSIRGRQHGTFRDGVLYLATRHGIFMFDLQEEEDRVIGFPAGAKEPGLKASLGILGGSVCYAELRGLRLQVWALEDHDDDYNWTLKHNAGINGIGAPRAGGGRNRCIPHILAFHPHSEAVFFLVNSRVIVYDLNSMALEDAYKLGAEKYEVLTATGFPFSPCSIDVLDIRKAKTKNA